MSLSLKEFGWNRAWEKPIFQELLGPIHEHEIEKALATPFSLAILGFLAFVPNKASSFGYNTWNRLNHKTFNVSTKISVELSKYAKHEPKNFLSAQSLFSLPPLVLLFIIQEWCQSVVFAPFAALLHSVEKFRFCGQVEFETESCFFKKAY